MTDTLSELRHRVFFLIFALFVYRLGAYVPVPGIDPVRLSEAFKEYGAGLLAMFNVFSGGSLERFSVFALGLMPYISASIVVQLLSAVVPHLENLKKSGELGQAKISQYSRYLTVVLGLFQSLGIAVALEAQGMALYQGFLFRVLVVSTLLTGTIFLMWLGGKITERGIGNGISIIIFAGIVSGVPGALSKVSEMVRVGQMHFLLALFLFSLAAAVVLFVVFVERAQRKILVNHAKRQVGNRLLSAQSSHLPLKLNMSGVIPPIFASSIILFPATLLSWFGAQDAVSGESASGILANVAAALSPGQPFYVLLYVVAIVFFCFFYTALVFNSRDTAENLKKSGAYVPGIRPGLKTAEYIDRVLLRLTFFGAIYVAFVCVLPELIGLKWDVPFYFGGTSLLIVVVVVMDFMAQLQTHMMSYRYDSLMKKSALKLGRH